MRFKSESTTDFRNRAENTVFAAQKGLNTPVEGDWANANTAKSGSQKEK